MKIYLTDYRIASTREVELFDDVLYPQRVHWFPETYKNAHTGLIYAPHRLADKVLDREILESLKSSKVGKTAFILASGNAHFAGINPRVTKPSRLTYQYKFLPLSLTQVYAGRVAQACGANDLITTDATACVSSLKVLMDVVTIIKFYGFSRVVVLGVEDAVSHSVLDFFGESGACLTQAKEESQDIKPSAFDDRNEGFYVGQGAVLAVFEAEGAVTKDPKFELKGAWSASEEVANAIGQREDGQGYVNAINGALFHSGVVNDEISIIKTHGTGTKSNNQAEKAAILSSFTDFVATSYKQKIGHTMGASGLLETILLWEDLCAGQVPAIENRTESDKVFLSEPVDAPDGYCLSLAAGMGNVYSAAIFNMRV
jgi:3-oxoacyl-(acyl-carrier-protein) synthase